MSEARRLLSTSTKYQSKTETIPEDPREGLDTSSKETQIRHRIGADQLGPSGQLWSPLTPKVSRKFFAMDSTPPGPTSPVFKPTTTSNIASPAGGASTTQYGTLESSLHISSSSPLLLASTPKRSILVDIHPTTHFTRKQLFIGSIALLFFLSAVTVTLTIGLPRMEAAREQYFAAKFASSDVHEQVFAHQTIIVDSAPECAGIGKAVLELRNGTAIDAALAALLCAQVAAPHLTGGGLVGGFQMLHYSAKDARTYTVDARTRVVQVALNNRTSVEMHIPSMIESIRMVNTRWGRLKLAKLIEPSVELDLNTVHVTKQLASVVRQNSKMIETDKQLRQLFLVVNQSTTMRERSSKTATPQEMKLIDEDDRFQNVRLGQTLKALYDEVNGRDPANGFLTESFLQDIIDSIGKMGYKVSNDAEEAIREELASFQPTISPTSSQPLFNGSLLAYSMSNTNSSAAQMITFLNLLEQVMSKKDSDFNYCNDKSRSLKEGATEFHTVIEALKIIAKLAQSGQHLSDEIIDAIAERLIVNKKVDIDNYVDSDTNDFFPSEPMVSTSSILVYDGDTGDVVVITSHAPSLFNPDLSYHKSSGLFLPMKIIKTSKPEPSYLWPISPVSPILLVDSETHQVRFATSVSGPGNELSSSLMSLDAQLQVVYKIFLNCQTLKSSTDESRFYYTEDGHSMVTSYESTIPTAYLDLLARLFDHYDLQPLDVNDGQLAGVYSIYRMDNNQQIYNQTLIFADIVDNFQLSSMVDFRQGGYISGD